MRVEGCLWVERIYCSNYVGSMGYAVAQSLSCAQLCDPMDWSMAGLPVLHHLPELAQIHVHSVSDAIQPSHPLTSPSPPALLSFPAPGSFLKSQIFASGGQSIGTSALASVLPMNIQDWPPLVIPPLFSRSILDTYRPGEFIFQCHIF